MGITKLMNSPLRKSPKIKLVTLLPKYFQITQDNEMLVTDKSAKRANLLLARLSFQSRRLSFAIPWRSNIKNDNWIKSYVYPLPTTSKTKDNYIACFDYKKMCPIPKYAKSLYQQYLSEYDLKNIPYAVNIEKDLNKLDVWNDIKKNN